MNNQPPGARPTASNKPAAPVPVDPEAPLDLGKIPLPAASSSATARQRKANGAKSAHDAKRAAPLVRSVEYGNLTWVDLQRPSGAEIEWLHTHYPNLHTLHFVDVTSPYQHCKLDERNDYLFLVLHFPFVDKSSGLLVASEVDIFVGPGYVITAHAGQLRPLMGLLDQVRDITDTRAAVMSRGSGYLLYTILDKLVEYCFPLLNRIDQNIERVESLIFSDKIRRNVFEISMVRREILAFRHVIQPQFEVMQELEERSRALRPLLGEDFGDYFGNLNNRMAKIWHTIEAHKEVIEGLNDTHDSLINAHINIVIKVLTVFSVLLLPMTLISSIYGMNFAVLPLSNDPDGFWLAMAAMFVVALAMLVFFKLRRWV